MSVGANILKSNRWIAYDLSSQAFKIAKYASEELDASFSIAPVEHSKGSDRRMKNPVRQPLGLETRHSGLSDKVTAPQEAVADTSMIGGLEDVVAVDNPPVKPEDPYAVSKWLHANIRNQSKDTPKEGLPQKFESNPMGSGRIDIFDDPSNDLITN